MLPSLIVKHDPMRCDKSYRITEVTFGSDIHITDHLSRFTENRVNHFERISTVNMKKFKIIHLSVEYLGR